MKEADQDGKDIGRKIAYNARRAKGGFKNHKFEKGI